MNLVLIGGLIVLVCVLYYFYAKSKNANSSNSQANSQTNVPTISINKVVPSTTTPTSIPFVTLTSVPLATPSSAPFVAATLAPFVTPSSEPLATPTSANFSEANTPVPYSTQAVVAFLTTPLPTTLAPIITPADSNDPIVGNWDSYVSSGAQLGPVTLLFIGGKNGINNYYIDGDKLSGSGDDMKMLAVNPVTLTATLTGRSDLLTGEGNIMMSGGKAFKIGTSDNYVNLSRAAIAPVNSTDPIVGNWDSYVSSGAQLGPVTITSTGGKDGLNTYYIDGDLLKTFGDGYKMLTVNPKTLTATLTGRSDIMKDASVMMSGGKAFKIASDYLNLSRAAIAPANSTDPIVGVWPTYTMTGNQLGPVTITSTGGKDGINTYFMDGDVLKQFGFGDDYKMLQVDTTQSPPTATMPRRPDLMKDAPVIILGGNRAIRISSTYITLNRLPSR